MRVGTGPNWATVCVSATAANFVLLLMLYVGRNAKGDLGTLVLMLAVGVWAVSPHLVLLGVPVAFTYWKNYDMVRDVVILIGALIVAAFGVVVYVDAFFIHLDALNAFAFLFVPLLQWFGVVVTFGVAVVASKFVDRTRRSRSCPS